LSQECEIVPGHMAVFAVAEDWASNKTVKNVSSAVAATAVDAAVVAATGNPLAGKLANGATTAVRVAAPDAFDDVASKIGASIAIGALSIVAPVILAGIFLWAWLDGDTEGKK